MVRSCTGSRGPGGSPARAGGRSGPLRSVQVYESSVTSSGSNSFQIGTTHSLGVSVAVRGRYTLCHPQRVLGGDRGLQGLTRRTRAATQAHDDVEPAVVIDDGATASALMETVDILRHHLAQRAN